MKISLHKIGKLLLLTGLAVSIQACTKTRTAQFAPGAGEDLLAISDFDGKEFSLLTESELSMQDTTASKQVSVSSSSMQQLSVVKYTTDATLLDSTAFVGKPKHKYTIRYVLTDNFLKIYKIAKKEDLSLNELAYAEDDSKSLLKVPLMGYPIKGYYTVERDRNDYNEQTTRLVERSKDKKDSATHFRFDRQGKQIFQAIQKIDTFPTAFFKGDWYYAETVVSTNYTDQSDYGNVFSRDSFGNAASKVRFKINSNGVQFYSLNVDPTLSSSLDSRDENKVSVLTIPAEFKDFKQAELGNDKALREEEDTKNPIANRGYVALKLNSAEDIFTSNTSDSAAEITDLQVDDNYFSFTTVTKKSSIKIRHSLMKAQNRNYKPKKYFAADQKTFGFFPTRVNYLQDRKDLYSESDINQFYFVNRFNPNLKEIKFYLSKNSPDWSRPIAVASVNEWNKAFAAAMVPITITLADTKVDLGDIRYNILNLVDQPDDGFPWGGLGPSVTDSSTGEIISSTANVNLNDMIGFIVSISRRMADAKQGKLDIKYLLATESPATALVDSNGEITEDDSDDESDEAPTKSKRRLLLSSLSFPRLALAMDSSAKLKEEVFSFTMPAYGPKGIVQGSRQVQFNSKFGLKLAKQNKAGKLVKTEPVFQMAKKRRLLSTFNQTAESDLKGSYYNVINAISSSCPKVEKYIGNLTADSKRASTADEYELFKECARIVAPNMIVPVLSHEMGHNFGLRHNFYGSVDKANWLEAETSSIMEYTVPNAKAGLGKYDIAAIRWGYQDKVETSDGQIIQANPEQTIQQAFAAAGKSPHIYKYCTDENADRLNLDPMCARQDYGTSPIEIVNSLIMGYETSLAANSQRLGRLSLNSQRSSLMRAEAFLIPLKRYYDFFRQKVAEYAGAENSYLENYSIDEYQKLLKRMSQDERYKQIFADYYPAAMKARVFFKNLTFLPNRYCVTKREIQPELFKILGINSNYKLYALSDIRDELYRTKSVTVNSCQDPAVITYLKAKQSTLVSDGSSPEVGFYLNDQYQEVDPANAVNVRSAMMGGQIIVPEISGTMMDRYHAVQILSARFPTSFLSNVKSFYPNFLDEPDFRADFEDTVVSRIVNGLDMSSLRDPKLTSLLNKNKTEKNLVARVLSPNFKDEKDLLGMIYESLISGELIPGKTQASTQRLKRFTTQYAFGMTAQDAAAAGKEAVEYNSGGFSRLAFKDDNPIAFQIISRLNRTTSLIAGFDRKPSIGKNLASDFEIAIKENIPSLEDIKKDKISILEFFTARSNAQKALLTKYEPLGDSSVVVIEIFFQQLDSQYNQILNTMVQAGATKEEFSKPMVFVKLPTGNWTDQGEKVTVQMSDQMMTAFSRETVLQMLAKLRPDFPSLEKSFQMTKQAAALDREDLSAQADLLTSAMQIFGGGL